MASALQATWLVMMMGLWLAFPAAADVSDDDVVHQLRIYELFDDTRQVFHDRFRDHAIRIMKRHDFRIIAMWEARNGDRTEFVYLLEWPDEATMKDRWAKFLADQEWVDIKARTRAAGLTLVGDIQDRTLRLTDYSAQQITSR